MIMPLTVITLKNVPPSLRGDLSKWMSEIATGVYIGNFNRRIREHLWERVSKATGVGEATLSYSTNNELGYEFVTLNTMRQVVDCEGIPLVRIRKNDTSAIKLPKYFSRAAKAHNARKFSSSSQSVTNKSKEYVVIDLETSGLDAETDHIIEIGAVKATNSGECETLSILVQCPDKLSQTIIQLTGIDDTMLSATGIFIADALDQLLEFIGDRIIVGYRVDFDLDFINHQLKLMGRESLKNTRYDLYSFAKKEKMFLGNYKLDTVLEAYGINEEVPHRALPDAQLIYQLSTKVKLFQQLLKKKR